MKKIPETSEVPNKAETWHRGCFFPLPRFSIASDLCNRSSIAEIKRRSKKGRFLWIHSCEVLKHIWQSDGILFKVVGLAKFWEICKHCQNLGKGMIITGRPQTSFKAIIKHSFWVYHSKPFWGIGAEVYVSCFIIRRLGIFWTGGKYWVYNTDDIPWHMKKTIDQNSSDWPDAPASGSSGWVHM